MKRDKMQKNITKGGRLARAKFSGDDKLADLSDEKKNERWDMQKRHQDGNDIGEKDFTSCWQPT
jgi:hypothetical protein